MRLFIHNVMPRLTGHLLPTPVYPNHFPKFRLKGSPHGINISRADLVHRNKQVCLQPREFKTGWPLLALHVGVATENGNLPHTLEIPEAYHLAKFAIPKGGHLG